MEEEIATIVWATRRNGVHKICCWGLWPLVGLPQFWLPFRRGDSNNVLSSKSFTFGYGKTMLRVDRKNFHLLQHKFSVPCTPLSSLSPGGRETVCIKFSHRYGLSLQQSPYVWTMLWSQRLYGAIWARFISPACISCLKKGEICLSDYECHQRFKKWLCAL